MQGSAAQPDADAVGLRIEVPGPVDELIHEVGVTVRAGQDGERLCRLRNGCMVHDRVTQPLGSDRKDISLTQYRWSEMAEGVVGA